ncbi:uncharacterized protein LOC112563001 [Pomacea canaliculata]|uniref:uncharacterized protein LOC112563001 n=1 Tax=Pomacea canaliculata TaxID=400727 RepID=UPI000D7361FD|nr:uncharacterized protein LOC112563001 [Pomacea canaliculata]
MPREGRYPSLPILYTKGSHFDVGYMTGTTFADRIRRYWHDDENLSQPSRALYESRDGRELCDVLQKKGEDNFPQYAAEIRGLAAGVGVSYEEMFFQNSILDMMYMDEGVVLDLLGKTVPLTRLLERCSTVLLNRPDVKVIGHNEDDYTALQQYGYMVSAVVDDPDFPSMLQGQGTNGYDNNKEGLSEDKCTSSRVLPGNATRRGLQLQRPRVGFLYQLADHRHRLLRRSKRLHYAQSSGRSFR